ncbi:MAG: aminopeptidase N [Oligoflexales bacterium]|nr:aminopeptidase N [Oligoflexales bacterium]
MTASLHTVKRLEDYSPPFYTVKHVDLVIDIYEGYTDVVSTLHILPYASLTPLLLSETTGSKTTGSKILETGPKAELQGPSSRESPELLLNGVRLQLLSLAIDGKPLDSNAYTCSDDRLTLKHPPMTPFSLSVKNRIQPQLNTELEGLYSSRKGFFTQCEPEGFRRITYFLDRPDVMATYTTKIQADKKTCPILLSNGNLLGKGDLPAGRHWVHWDDPFPKPSYLFALVAADLFCLSDVYTTVSGKAITLEIYAEKDDLKKCHFAMTSLKNAMNWDERAYGRECDLLNYKVVAVRDFNMGAMENKGLNIFNTALILASQETATDEAFQSVESVIGHEYFHNWTGNRITCRDWFQLCLKEGLTVFREQEFIQDLYKTSFFRIKEIDFLRQNQFLEDEGVLAHPPRPDHYVEINNFYTHTIYYKGAELIHMLKTLLGPTKFKQGMDLYFTRYDGQAITQEDFMSVMAEVSGKNLDQFFLWYTQIGNPHVQVQEDYSPQDQSYKVTFSQSTKAFGNTKKPSPPRHIPIRVGFLNKQGDALSPKRVGGPNPNEKKQEEHMLELTEHKQTFTFSDLEEKPVISLFRGFSAPVTVHFEQSIEDLRTLMEKDSDPFNRWESGQKIFKTTLLALSQKTEKDETLVIPKSVLSAFHSCLKRNESDKNLHAISLSLPSIDSLVQGLSEINVDSLYKARLHLTRQLASTNQEKLLEIYRTEQKTSESQANPAHAAGSRRLKNLCLHYLASNESEEGFKLLEKQYHNSSNMTDTLAALREICHGQHPKKRELLQDFYQHWQHDDLVIDAWFSTQALSPLDSVHDEMLTLTQHPAFRVQDPNRLRALVSSFCKNNWLQFHAASGRGYRFCREFVSRVNKINPQMAASIAKSFSQWKKLDKNRQDLIHKLLDDIAGEPNLSPDVYEVVNKIRTR